MDRPHIDDLVGTSVALSRDRVVTVGRDGDLSFPGNPHLHRHLVAVYWRDGGWWAENVGTWITVRYSASNEPLSSVLGVGKSIRLIDATTHVVFRAANTEYEVVIRIPADSGDDPPLPAAPIGVTTLGPDALTIEQLIMLTAFCEPFLRAPGIGLDNIPSMQSVEQLLGWSAAKLRRKLDHLCEKLARAGVAGLSSVPHVHARNRRIALIEWALATGIISSDSLKLLELRPFTPLEGQAET